jgi:hypothetical protein
MNRRWYLISLVPLIFGVIIGAATFLSAYVNIKQLPRLVVPGEKTLHFDGGIYLLYGEVDSVVDGTTYHADELSLRCTVHDAARTDIPLRAPRSTSRYGFSAYDGRSVYEVSILKPGDYTVACETSSTQHAVVAIGHNIGITLIIGIIAFLTGIVGAVIAFVIVWRKRTRSLAAAHDAIGS